MKTQRKGTRKTGGRQSGTGRRSPKVATAGRKAVPRKAAALKPAGTFALPPECLIASVDEIKADLLPCAGLETHFTIDATSVQRIDTACLQVLAAFVRERRAAGLPFEWIGVPASVTDAAALLNLTHSLGIAAPASDGLPA